MQNQTELFKISVSAKEQQLSTVRSTFQFIIATLEDQISFQGPDLRIVLHSWGPCVH